MAPLSPETRNTLQERFQSTLWDVSTAEDIGDIASRVKVCNEDGFCITYEEASHLRFTPSESGGRKKRDQFKLFFHLRKILLSLTSALEGEARSKEIDLKLLPHRNDAAILYGEKLNQFLTSHFAKDSLVLSVLRCICRTMIEPVQRDFKKKVGTELILTEVANSWRVTVTICPDKLYVIHHISEQCSVHRFLLTWEFTTSVFLVNPNTLDDIHLKVTDLRFNLDLIAPRSQNEVIQAMRPYMDLPLLQFMKEKVIPINAPLSLDGVGVNDLLEGEEILGIFEDVLYLHSQLPSDLSTSGRLIVSNYKIVFASNEDYEVISVPLTTISKVVHKDKKELEFICKEILIFRLVFTDSFYNSFVKLIERVFPIHPCQLFAFTYHQAAEVNVIEEKLVPESMATNGWRAYNATQEFQRMKLEEYRWRLSKINSTFQVCDSYPKRLILPQSFDDENAVMAAQARVNGRIPVLTWKHRNSSFLCHGSGLVKINKVSDSLPARGADKQLVKAIMQNCCNIDGLITPRGASSGHIRSRSFDSRVKAKKKRSRNRLQQKEDTVTVTEFYVIEIAVPSEAGKPVNEIEDSEVTWSRDTLIVEPLSEMKECYKKLQKLCLTPYNNAIEEHWLTYVDGSSWLQHIRTLMRSAHRITELMGLGSSVLLSYAEPEFDRACQISSLAQLWMDPYYRTLKGFIVLIEKEWLSFGHPFVTRCGYFSGDDGPDIVPVFMQFLDCVWQTMNQFPHHFEFNNKLLIELSTHCYSSKYGTFAFNNEHERRDSLARSTTESFWTHVLSDRSYKNPLFVGALEATLVPSYNPRALSLWTSYFLRWYPGLELVSLPRASSENCGKDILSMINQQIGNTDAIRFATKLERLKALEKELQKVINLEKEKLGFLKLGMTLAQANEKILLRKQSTTCDELEIRSDLMNSRRHFRAKQRRSTPSQGIPDDIVQLLNLGEVPDITVGPSTARPSVETDVPSIIVKEDQTTSSGNAPRKKKQVRRSLSRKIDSVLSRKSDL